MPSNKAQYTEYDIHTYIFIYTSVDPCISMHSTWFERTFTQTVRKSLVRMCSDSRWGCVPSCLQACLTIGWTCHLDQPLQSESQNGYTIDSSSSTHMLVSSRTAPRALTKSWRNNFFREENLWRLPADFCLRWSVIRGSFFQLFGMLFVVFSGSWAPLGQLGFQPWIWPGFTPPFWHTFGSLFCFLADAIFMDFSWFFQTPFL